MIGQLTWHMRRREEEEEEDDDDEEEEVKEEEETLSLVELHKIFWVDTTSDMTITPFRIWCY